MSSPRPSSPARDPGWPPYLTRLINYAEATHEANIVAWTAAFEFSGGVSQEVLRLAAATVVEARIAHERATDAHEQFEADRAAAERRLARIAAARGEQRAHG